MKYYHITDTRMGVTSTTTAPKNAYAFRVAADGEPSAAVPPPASAPPHTDYVSRAELAAVAAERDRLKASGDASAAKLADLTSKASALDTLTASLGGDPAQAAAELAELRKFKTESEMAGKTALEKLEAGIVAEQNARKLEVENHQKTLSKATEDGQKITNELKSKVASLMQYKLQAEIQRVASDAGAANPAQIVKMLHGDFTLNDKEDFVFNTTTDKGTPTAMNIEERVKAFLGEEANSNLLATVNGVPRKKAAGTSGTHGSAAGDNTASPKGKEDGSFMSQLGRAITDAERHNPINYGKDDEDIALSILIASKGRERADAAKAKGVENKRLPGEISYRDRQ